MKKICFELIVLFALLFVMPFCNQTEENQEREEEMDNPQGRQGNEMTDFNEMDKKMREIMHDKTSDNEEIAKEVQVVQSKGAEKADVNLKIGAGKLRLSGGSSELMLAGFLYTDESWKPQVMYKVKDKTGYLSVEQPESQKVDMSDDDRYVWNLKFNNQIPLEFNIELGAGVSEISLGELNIDDFSMTMGIGKTEIDLRGNWKKSTTIHLIGGIGLSKIYLPKNAGVKLNVDKGIGALDFTDLIQKSRNEYVNRLYETADVVLTINLKTGIGKIEIE